MEDISLHILDIVENAILKGKATKVKIIIKENIREDILVLKVIDNGIGIKKEDISKVTSPFYSNEKRIGLGLALLQQSVEEAEGKLKILSKENRGTVVEARFKASHIDRRPLGDITETLLTLIIGYPEVNFKFCLIKDKISFTVDTSLYKKDFDDISKRIKFWETQLKKVKNIL